MDKSMMTIEQILRDGGTVDEILDMVRVEASRIQTKMKEEEEAKKKEQERQSQLKVVRQEFTAAFINYLIALGEITEEEVAEMGVEMFEKVIEEAETLLPQRKHTQDEVIKRIEKMLKDNSAVTRLGQETPVKVTIKKDQISDDWFHEFVKSL
jgi:hypothetical protein